MVLPMVLFPRFECSTTPIVILSRRKEEERKNVELKTCSVLALRIPDLFMERVRGDGRWSLFCPMRLLAWLIVGDNNLKKLYTQHESETETGTPYILFHDTAVTDLQLQVGKNRVTCWFRP
uniref:Ribonucleotide reductase large subunit C-terminal domain-containing protein n=1 Tax=Populus alba TaxID=43335 RepID=A0A4U5R717_POPAL|nr:hypothetical protein D5086_0000003960 [Populus alba]